MRPRRHAQEAEGMSSRRKQKQERKRERERASSSVPQGVTIAPEPAEEWDREALLKEPGAVELHECASCGRWFDLGEGEGVEYGDKDGELHLCAACFIAAAP